MEASTTRRVDSLQGLKENVIIGRLIPTGAVYRKRFVGEDGEKPKDSEDLEDEAVGVVDEGGRDLKSDEG